MAIPTTSTDLQEMATITPSNLGGIEIRFDGKPSEDIRSKLKSSKSPFNFSDTNDDPRWWAKHTPESWRWAKVFAAEFDIDFDVPLTPTAIPKEAIASKMTVPTEVLELVVPEVKLVEAVVEQKKPTSKTSLFSLSFLDDLIGSVQDSLDEEKQASARLKNEVLNQLLELAAADDILKELPPETRFGMSMIGFVTYLGVAAAAMLVRFEQTAIASQVSTADTIAIITGREVATTPEQESKK